MLLCLTKGNIFWLRILADVGLAGAKPTRVSLPKGLQLSSLNLSEDRQVDCHD